MIFFKVLIYKCVDAAEEFAKAFVKGDPGPQGPAGVKGDPGPQGPAGVKGDQGERGLQGQTGQAGPAGQNGTNGTNGTNGRSYIWHGAYDSNHAYAVDDTVSYLGSSYVCILASTGNLPTNTTYWNVMASKGDGAACPIPVGCGIPSFDSDWDPATEWSGTTWELAEGVFIAGYKSGDSKFGTVGGTGGAKEVNIEHNHSPGTLSLPNHITASMINQGGTSNGTVTNPAHGLMTGVTANGGSTALDALPPYKVAKWWFRLT